jgi:hypothetical protein
MSRFIRMFPVLALLLLFASGTSISGDHSFVGTKNCRKCHLKQWKSWSTTTMATTFETLRPGERAEAKKAAGLDPDKDYTKDPTCLPCHTTGYGVEGGFVDEASSPELVGVSCEMCHGAGGTYTKDELMSLKNKEYKLGDVVAAGMVEKVSIDQCKGCHNAHSPFVADDFVFDYDANKDKGTHENYPLKYAH